MPLYVPRHNREEDVQVLHAFIEAHPFATLVSAGDDGPEATHIPLLFDATRGRQGMLLGHLARANAHWKWLEKYPDVLAIFHGPQAFVSAAWYSPPDAVSTWNYAVVHARGTVRVTHDQNALHVLVERLRQRMDAPQTQAMPYPEKLLGGIVGLEIEITRLDGKFKLSQNRSGEDHARVQAALAASGAAEPQRVAALMAPHVSSPETGEARRA